MSLAYEDWKRFDNLSGQLMLGDPLHPESAEYINVQQGEWVAMCVREDDCNDMERVLMMRSWLADVVLRGKRCDIGGEPDHIMLDSISESGFMFAVDRWLGMRLAGDFKVPEHRLIPDIVERFGRPDDDGKEPETSFIESCLHMGRDACSGMPMVDEIPYGAAFEIGSGNVKVNVVLDKMRDAIGIEFVRGKPVKK